MRFMENIDEKEKDRRLTLFWSIYCMDRALSLRLGRATSIPDYDIDVPNSLQSPESKSASGVFHAAYQLWLELARIQGQVYEKLYSPAALRQDEANRVAEARNLASQMQDRVMQPFQVSVGLQAIRSNGIEHIPFCIKCDNSRVFLHPM